MHNYKNLAVVQLPVKYRKRGFVLVFKILKYMRGYVKIKVYGYSPERFLNLCSSRQILIWDLKNTGDAYEMYMSVKGFRELQPVVRKTKTRVQIVKRRGFPFFMHKYRKRKIFFAGIFLCAVFIYVLSLFIWDIRFVGNSVRTTEVLMDFMERNELHHGMWKSDIDCDKVEAALRNEFDDIIWASVEIKGTRLIVYVQESLKVEQGGENIGEEPTDLCTEKDGTVERMITRAGTPVVSVGSPVSAGAVLVQGRMEILGDDGSVVNYQYCAADADVYLRTAYNYQEQFSMTYTDKQYEKEKEQTYYIKTFSTRWDLDFFEKERKTPHEEIVEEKQLHLWNNFYLPFYFGDVTKKYYKNVEKVYTEEEAEALAQKKLKQFCDDLQKKGVQIVENNVTIQVDEKNCTSSGTVVVIEKTGKRQPTEVLEVQQEEMDEYNGAQP